MSVSDCIEMIEGDIRKFADWQKRTEVGSTAWIIFNNVISSLQSIVKRLEEDNK